MTRTLDAGTSRPALPETETRKALERMVALYEGEYDADAPFIRPDWLVAALASEDVQGWRTITTAPKDGTNILYRNQFREIGFCHWNEGYDDEDQPCWWDNERDDEVVPTVWLPTDALPAFSAPPAPETRT